MPTKKQVLSRDGGAGLKDLRSRMKTIVSIEKITKSMKMVASAKLKGAQNKAEHARAFSKGMEILLEPLYAKKEGAPEEEAAKDKLAILLATDKGLCGPVNGQLLRYVRTALGDAKTQYIVIGDKGKDILRRRMPKDILMTVGKTAKPSFTDACMIATTILKANLPYNSLGAVQLFQNKFVNALLFKPLQRTLPLPSVMEKLRPQYYGVNFHDEYPPTAEALIEFNMAISLWYGLMETAAVELSSRMTSMDNASRNAADMFKRIRLMYNRKRQGAITTELTEIISGAEAAME